MGAEDRKLARLREIVPEIWEPVVAGGPDADLLVQVRDVLWPTATQRTRIVVFVVRQGVARSSEIARHIGVDVSSVGGHLRTLTKQGLLTRRDRGVYVPGPKAPRLAEVPSVAPRPDGARFVTGPLPPSVTHAQLAAAFAELAERTGNRSAYFPALAEFMFAWIGHALPAADGGRLYCPHEHRGWAGPVPLDRIPARYGGGWVCPGILPDGEACGYEAGTAAAIAAAGTAR